jgi:hypothetical protein
MLAFSGALLGFSLSTLIPHRYQARTEFVFLSPYDADAQTLFDRASDITLLPQSLELMIRRSPYYKNRLYVESIADLISETRGSLNVKSAAPVAGKRGGVIEFEDDDVETALDVTRVMLSEFGNNAARAANAKRSADVIRIVRTPDAHLTGLTPWLLTRTGLLAGLIVALLIRILLPRTQPATQR